MGLGAGGKCQIHNFGDKGDELRGALRERLAIRLKIADSTVHRWGVQSLADEATRAKLLGSWREDNVLLFGDLRDGADLALNEDLVRIMHGREIEYNARHRLEAARGALG